MDSQFYVFSLWNMGKSTLFGGWLSTSTDLFAITLHSSAEYYSPKAIEAITMRSDPPVELVAKATVTICEGPCIHSLVLFACGGKFTWINQLQMTTWSNVRLVYEQAAFHFQQHCEWATSCQSANASQVKQLLKEWMMNGGMFCWLFIFLASNWLLLSCEWFPVWYAMLG